jgi:lantibiotic transport system permease protein
MNGLRVLPLVIATETAKLKRTLALGMTVIAPMVVVILYFLVGMAGAGPATRPGSDAWVFLTRNTVQLWTLLMLPLFITLEASLLAGLEHTERNWKFLLSLPIPRWTIYVAKLIVVLALVWLAHAVLVAGTVLSGHVLRQFAPALKLGAMPISQIAGPVAKVSLSVVLAVTIQHWVSLRWPSFVVAMGFGMCAMVVGFLAANSAKCGPWVPWSLTLHTLMPRGTYVINPMVFSAIAGLIVAIAGAVHFTRHEK